MTDFFTCHVGVKQGENVSPFLFSIYLNDSEEFFIQNGADQLLYIDTLFQEHMGVFVKLFILLYADDTVLMSETAKGLQNAFREFESYCTIWKLKVNLQKTNVVIFEKRKSNMQNIRFMLFGEELHTNF